MSKKANSELDKFLSSYRTSILDKKNAAALADKYPPLSTGSRKLDDILGGGLKRGYISEVLGKEYGGKTTLALSVAALVLKAGGKVLFVDDERGLDIGSEDDTLVTDSHNRKRNWLRKLGIDPFDENFVIAAPDTGEQMYEMVLKAVNLQLFDLIILDSIASVATVSEIQGDIGDANIGAVARLNSQALKALVKALKKHLFTHFLVINQVRDKIGFMQQGVKGTGGRSILHYARQRIMLTPMHKPKPLGSSGEFITKVRVQLLKSAFSTGGRETDIIISSEYGIDSVQEYLEIAYDLGYAVKKGSWVHLYDTPVDFKALEKANKHKDPDIGYLGSAQGDSEAKKLLQETKLLEKIQAALNQLESTNEADSDDQGSQ